MIPLFPHPLFYGCSTYIHQIKSSGKYEIVELFNSQEGVAASMLWISATKKKIAGEYECRAHNKLSQPARAVATVTVFASKL